MPVKIKDYITRDTKVLMQTFNTAPRPEGIIQNQRLLLEVLCDIRKELLEVLHRLFWLGSTKPMKDAKVETEKEEAAPHLSRRAEAALPLKERVKIISERTVKDELASTDEDVEAF